MKFKKLLYFLGSFSLVTSSLVVIIACGNSGGNDNNQNADSTNANKEDTQDGNGSDNGEDTQDDNIDTNGGNEDVDDQEDALVSPRTNFNSQKDWEDYVNEQNWTNDFKDAAKKGVDLANNKIKNGHFEEKEIPEDFAIPDSIKEIYPKAFEGATIPPKFKIPDSVDFIGGGAFEKATIHEDFEISKNPNLKLINNSLFYLSIIKKGFKIPDNIELISIFAFYEATLPEGFKIPNSVTSIEANAFMKIKFTSNDLTWFDNNKLEQSQSSTPQKGWYIGRKSNAT